MPIELFLFVLLVCTAVVISRLRDLFAAAMLTGIFSLVSACLFTVMDAVDVAFTEAAVGAGIATILMLATLSLTNRKEEQQPIRLLPVVVVLLTGGVLVLGTVDMPAYGAADAPMHTHPMYTEFIEGSKEKVDVPNVVTAVLASYRGYDTFGETTVIFTAATGVLLLLSGRRRRRSGTDNEGAEAEAGVEEGAR